MAGLSHVKVTRALLRAGSSSRLHGRRPRSWGRDDDAGQTDQTWPRKIEEHRAEALAFTNVHCVGVDRLTTLVILLLEKWSGSNAAPAR